jgi:phage-related protein
MDLLFSFRCLIELSKTNEYKNFAQLEKVNIGDTVILRHIKWNINVKVPVVKIVRDELTGLGI